MGPVASDLSYTQFAQLPHIINKAGNSPEQLREAAQHFESLFIDMWLKAAREANEAVSTDSFLNSNEMKMHQQMFDHEMSVHLAKNGGIGLADVIVRQLNGEAVTHSSNTPSNIPSTAPSTDLSTSPTTTPTASTQSTRVAVFDSAKDFVQEIKPLIAKALKNASIPLEGVLSQAALETGWGNKVIAAGDGQVSHNLFGIKASSSAEPSVSISSMEFELGRWVNKKAQFRSYPNWEASVRDYVEKLSTDPRYTDVISAGRDVEKFARGLADSGYATDPNYAQKLIDVSKRIRVM